MVLQLGYLLPCLIGLLVIHISDPAAIKKVPFVKPLVWTVGACLIVYGAVTIWLAPDKLELPVWSAWLGWVLLVLSSVTLAYSLFINLPFFKTYVATGTGDHLVTSGFYALVRHPGVIWTVLLAISFVLASRSRPALAVAPCFLALDLIFVFIQDRFFFGRMFPGYEEYRRRTPMLLPNRNSVRAFVDSLKDPKAPETCDPLA